ncbi:MAG: hypothetical protein V4601_06830 [Pseudomonadota bacterium]
MRIRTLIGAALMGMTGPAFADVTPPWGDPVCFVFKPNYERDKKGMPPTPPESRYDIPQPFAHDRRVYAGIYQSVEQYYAPLARFFWPALTFEESNNSVRISRVSKGKPPRRVKALGALRTIDNTRRISMRINKCNGAISELRFEKGG